MTCLPTPALLLCGSLLYLEDNQCHSQGCGDTQGPWLAFQVPMNVKCACIIKMSRLAKCVVSIKGKQHGYALSGDMGMFIFLLSSSSCENSQIVVSTQILLFQACLRLSRTPVSAQSHFLQLCFCAIIYFHSNSTTLLPFLLPRIQFDLYCCLLI